MNTKTLVAINLSIFLWASSFSGIKSALTSYQPETIVFSRFLIAAILLMVFGLTTRIRLPEKRDISGFLLMGFIGIVMGNLAQTYSLNSISAGVGSLLTVITPVFATILATVLYREQLSRWGWLGIVISTCGIVAISLTQGSNLAFNSGLMIGIGAAMAMAIFFLLQKHYLERYTAIEITTYSIIAGTLLLLVFLPGFVDELRQARANATLALLFLGIFPSNIAYISWSYGLAKAPVSLATNFLNLFPVMGVVIAWYWLQEIPNTGAMLGGLLILVGVILVQRNHLATDKAVQQQSQANHKAHNHRCANSGQA